MAFLFYSLGLILTLCGLGYAFYVASVPMEASLVIGKVIAMVPGIELAGVGLLFLAIGGVLHRLDRLIAKT